MKTVGYRELAVIQNQESESLIEHYVGGRQVSF